MKLKQNNYLNASVAIGGLFCGVAAFVSSGAVGVPVGDGSVLLLLLTSVQLSTLENTDF